MGKADLQGQDTKPAKQKSKGAPRDGNAQDRTLPARVAHNYENHPSKGRDVGRGTKPVVGKL